MPQISVLDLTVSQVEAIELELGLPLTKWGTDTPSVARLYAKIAAAATGENEEKYRAMSLRGLIDLVSLEGSDPNP